MRKISTRGEHNCIKRARFTQRLLFRQLSEKKKRNIVKVREPEEQKCELLSRF